MAVRTHLKHLGLRHLAMTLLALALVFPGCASKRSPEPSPGCTDIANTGHLNVLTLNVLYDLPAAVREKSWADIAQFAMANNVHVLFIQEAVMTDVEPIEKLLGTSDSARDLQRALNGVSPKPYELSVAWETGVPLVLTTANAILSRCNITRHLWTFLPIESEEAFEGIDFKITRNVQLARMHIPGYGNLHIYNTHLCSACSVEALRRQVDALLAFVQRAEAVVPSNRVFLGGDFNIDLAKGAAERDSYEAIMNGGFKDIYADFRKTAFGESLETLCWNGIPDIHCTDGVSPLQGLIARKTGADVSRPTRIDYLFHMGADNVRASRVIFNPGNTSTGPINPQEPAVSDHSGVFAQITLSR